MTRFQFSPPETFLFSTEIPVMVQHINYGGHLGNDSLLSILHEARVRFLNHEGFSEFDMEGVGMIMADVYISYKSEVFYGEVVKVDVAIQNLGKCSCDFYYRVQVLKRAVAVAKTGMVFYDYSRKKIVKTPEKLKKIYSSSKD